MSIKVVKFGGSSLADAKQFEKVAKTYPYAQDIESERNLMRIAESKFL